MAPEPTPEEEWYHMLTEGEPVNRHAYHLLGMLPASPRCKLCAAPFKGWGGMLMRLLGRDQSQYNPRFCIQCDQFDNPGGAEIVLTMFFADVRGSTTLAEQMNASEFSRLMSRFYTVATDVLIESDAMVDRLIGDEVIGLYVPGMAGPQHPRHAIETARRLLHRMGHADAKGPWLPVGIGIHTGKAFVGVVGGAQGAPRDFTALGDNVNIAARLASMAGPGEILISDATYDAAGLDLGDLEWRRLELKGKSEPIHVRVLTVSGTD